MSVSKRKYTIVAIVAACVALLILALIAVAFRPTVVPDVREMPLAEATGLIEQAGLVVGTSSRVATSALGEGRVLAQRPAPEARVASRSSVDLTVTVQPSDAPVPDVTGATALAAERTLTAALYLPIRVDIFDSDQPRGNVVEQAPSAGTTWLTGRPVAIAVTAGADDGTAVEVPDLTGASIEAALATIEDAGLQSGGLVRDISAPQDNVVVDQLPDGGVMVRPGTTVLLLFKAP